MQAYRKVQCELSFQLGRLNCSNQRPHCYLFLTLCLLHCPLSAQVLSFGLGSSPGSNPVKQSTADTTTIAAAAAAQGSMSGLAGWHSASTEGSSGSMDAGATPAAAQGGVAGHPGLHPATAAAAGEAFAVHDGLAGYDGFAFQSSPAPAGGFPLFGRMPSGVVGLELDVTAE